MTAENPGWCRRQVGAITVTALLDGNFTGSLDLVAGIDRDAAAAEERARFRAGPPVLTVNAFLVEAAGRRVLIDTGCGGVMGPTLGLMTARLAELGVAPGQIDDVLLTHAHVDHVGGLLDGGAARFAAARVHLAAVEAGHWLDDAVMAAAPEAAQGSFAAARAALAGYADRLVRFTDGEVLPGITAVAAPGHTPGHTGYLIADGGERLLIWGDIVHLPGIQFARPEAGMIFDVDGQAAIATRRRVMAMAADERLCVAGMHLDFPAFGYVARAGEGFAFVPVQWMALRNG